MINAKLLLYCRIAELDIIVSDSVLVTVKLLAQSWAMNILKCCIVSVSVWGRMNDKSSKAHGAESRIWTLVLVRRWNTIKIELFLFALWCKLQGRKVENQLCLIKSPSSVTRIEFQGLNLGHKIEFRTYCIITKFTAICKIIDKCFMLSGRGGGI